MCVNRSHISTGQSVISFLDGGPINLMKFYSTFPLFRVAGFTKSVCSHLASFISVRLSFSGNVENVRIVNACLITFIATILELLISKPAVMQSHGIIGQTYVRNGGEWSGILANSG